MMRFRFGIAAAALCGSLIGCSQSPSQSTPTPSVGPVVSNTPPPKTTPSVVKPAPTEGTNSKPTTTTPGTNPSTPPEQGTKKPGTSATENPANWRPSKVSPKQVATMTDQALLGLRNVQADIQFRMKSSLGRASGKVVEKIQSPTVFSLQYPVLFKDKRHGTTPTTAYTRSDGKVITERIGEVTKVRSVGSSKTAAPTDLVQNWPSHGNREVFAGFVDGRQPFSEFIGKLSDPKNGYVMKVTERTLAYRGNPIRQYMLTATRSAAAAIKSGPSKISLIIDADIHLPVTIVASVMKPGAKVEDVLTWDANWTNNVKFDAKEFRPIPTGTTKA